MSTVENIENDGVSSTVRNAEPVTRVKLVTAENAGSACDHKPLQKDGCLTLNLRELSRQPLLEVLKFFLTVLYIGSMLFVEFVEHPLELADVNFFFLSDIKE